jgi:hypothetical protein
MNKFPVKRQVLNELYRLEPIIYFCDIFPLLEPLLVKLAKLVTEYKLNIQKSKIIDLTKETIASLVKHRIDNYTGEQTCSLQTKISKIVISLKILVLKDFLVGMETKLKNKIEIRLLLRLEYTTDMLLEATCVVKLASE